MKYFVNIFPVICLGFVWIRFQFLSEILWPTLTLKKNLNCATPPSGASNHAVLVMSCIFQMKNKFSSNSSLKKHILKFKRWELHQIEVSNDTFESHFRFYLTKNFFLRSERKRKKFLTEIGYLISRSTLGEKNCTFSNRKLPPAKKFLENGLFWIKFLFLVFKRHFFLS